MTTDSHGWHDDEETIVDGQSRPPSPRPGGAEGESGAAAGSDDARASHDSPDSAPRSAEIRTPAAPEVDFTPPWFYGVTPPDDESAGPAETIASGHAAHVGGQDPYLAAVARQAEHASAIPMDLPPPPPLPPLPPLPEDVYKPQPIEHAEDPAWQAAPAAVHPEPEPAPGAALEQSVGRETEQAPREQRLEQQLPGFAPLPTAHLHDF